MAKTREEKVISESLQNKINVKMTLAAGYVYLFSENKDLKGSQMKRWDFSAVSFLHPLLSLV